MLDSSLHLIWCLSLLEPAISASPRLRALNSGSQDNSQDEYNDDANSNVFNDFSNRIDSDVNAMWNSSPSEWILEYWEVFAGIMAVGFLIAFLLCCILCIIPCCMDGGGSNQKPLVVATQEEVDEKRRKLLENENLQESHAPLELGGTGNTKTNDDDQTRATRDASGHENEEKNQIMSPSLLSQISSATESIRASFSSLDQRNTLTSVDSSTIHSPTKRSPHSLSIENQPTVDSTPADPIFSASTSQKKSSRNSVRPVRRKRLWDEVVSVWSEFLGFAPSDEDVDRYRRYKAMNGASSRHKRSSGTLV